MSSLEVMRPLLNDLDLHGVGCSKIRDFAFQLRKAATISVIVQETRKRTTTIQKKKRRTASIQKKIVRITR